MLRAFAAVFSLSLAAVAAGGEIAGTVAASGGGSLVVYVEKGPATAEAQPERREVAQHDSQFEPRATWVHAGDSVDFVNRDNIYHNVFSSTDGSRFDLGLYRGGLKKTVQLQTPGEVDVYCNIHPEMRAKVLVLPPGARAVQVGADATFKMDDLPPGIYTLVAWSAVHEPGRAQVELKAGQKATANFALKSRASAGQHLNKNGEQYGRYK
ncbi:MAG TPA: carboxypeptidase regulatory-like domain-containing protein [Myxococcales bacterium]|jgi:plastocyanin|nr:carboxypeptidase regulatory-like domain-containing protein [Myxococcales bacterium]